MLLVTTNRILCVLSLGLLLLRPAGAQFYNASSSSDPSATGSFDRYGRPIEPTTTEEVFQNYPTGVAEYSGEWYSVSPLQCGHGCWVPASVYYFCVLNTTLPDGRPTNQDECNEYLCNIDTFSFVSACLNCVIANGEEKPLGFDDDPSTASTTTSRPFALPTIEPEGGYLDIPLANQWLVNITDRCRAAGMPLPADLTTFITATPTTTGPYSTAWTRGRTLTFATWTGLTPFSEEFFPTETPVWGSLNYDSTGSTSSSSSSKSFRGSGSPSTPATPTTSDAPSAGASSPNAGLTTRNPIIPPSIAIFIAILGLVW